MLTLRVTCFALLCDGGEGECEGKLGCVGLLLLIYKSKKGLEGLGELEGLEA